MLMPLLAEGSSFIQDETLLSRLEKCTNLPSAPGVAEQLLELGQSPEATLPQIARVISHDPALAAKLLRIANSPLYARRRKTENLRQAITLFGLNGALTLVLSFSMVKTLQGHVESGLDYGMFWRRSFTVATCCQILAEQMKITEKEDLFLAGLLQDIGMLALDKALPQLYLEIGHAQGSHRQLQSFERTEIGVDHAAVGAWLLQRWNFPDRLIQIVAASHDPKATDVETAYRAMARIVAFSSDMANILWDSNIQDKVACAMQRARQIIDVEPVMLAQLFAKLADELRSVASIYDIDLGDTVHLEGLQEQAREILMLRHLQTMHETKLLQAHKDSLESRAQELEERTRRDNLTKLYNRSYLDRVIIEEFEAAKLHGWPLTIVFIDLDHFKQVNDSHGHQAGDVVLKNVANILAQQARGGDVVSRYGGEEFVIILPGTGREGAALLCERVLTGLRRATTHGVCEHEPIVVTASIGIAVHGEQERFQCCGDLVRAADRALYAAKLSGRDRMVFYNAPVH